MNPLVTSRLFKNCWFGPTSVIRRFTLKVILIPDSEYKPAPSTTYTRFYLQKSLDEFFFFTVLSYEHRSITSVIELCGTWACSRSLRLEVLLASNPKLCPSRARVLGNPVCSGPGPRLRTARRAGDPSSPSTAPLTLLSC